MNRQRASVLRYTYIAGRVRCDFLLFFSLCFHLLFITCVFLVACAVSVTGFMTAN